MSLTFKQATDDILTLFETAWDTTGFVALYENAQDDIPETQDPWARVTIRHSPAGRQTLTGGVGTTRYERTGIFTAQVFIPNGEGLVELYSLGKTVADAFDGVASPGGVWFRDGRFTEVGPDGEWFQGNFTVAFAYDEVK